MPTTSRISPNSFLTTISGIADMVGEQDINWQSEYGYPTIKSI